MTVFEHVEGWKYVCSYGLTKEFSAKAFATPEQAKADSYYLWSELVQRRGEQLLRWVG